MVVREMTRRQCSGEGAIIWKQEVVAEYWKLARCWVGKVIRKNN
jgi:hypothetical protein